MTSGHWVGDPQIYPQGPGPYYVWPTPHPYLMPTPQYFHAPPLSEDDFRRIVREEVEKAIEAGRQAKPASWLPGDFGPYTTGPHDPYVTITMAGTSNQPPQETEK